MSDVRKYMVLTGLGASRDQLALSLIDAVKKRGCEVVECRLQPLGQQTFAALLVTGNWGVLGKLESALGGMARDLELQLHAAHTQGRQPSPQYMPYTAEVIAPQQARLLGALLRFFDAENVRITDTEMHTHTTEHTGALMCSIQLGLQVPLIHHPQTLRESFMDLCDDLHADGLLDPIRN